MLAHGSANAAEGDWRHAEVGGDVFVADAVDEAGVALDKPLVAFEGGALADDDL